MYEIHQLVDNSKIEQTGTILYKPK